jgi:hypothetical protein
MKIRKHLLIFAMVFVMVFAAALAACRQDETAVRAALAAKADQLFKNYQDSVRLQDWGECGDMGPDFGYRKTSLAVPDTYDTKLTRSNSKDVPYTAVVTIPIRRQEQSGADKNTCEQAAPVDVVLPNNSALQQRTFELIYRNNSWQLKDERSRYPQ